MVLTVDSLKFCDMYGFCCC